MPTPITAAGKAKLEEERNTLEASLPVIREAIAEAREKGDLKENAEYHAAREDLAMAQAKIGEINAKLSDAVIVDESQIDHSAIAFGATVELKDLSDGTTDDWQLVGPGEDDPLDNKILTSSPLGEALLGHAVGDKISFEAPAGLMEFEVMDISYDS